MSIENQNVEGLELVTIESGEFAELSVYQQSYVMGRGLNQAISSQDRIIEIAALITFGGNTEPSHADWVAYRDGAIKGHQEDEDEKSGIAPMRGPIAAKKDAQNGRQWFHRYCKKPLIAYWAAQVPAREFIAPFKVLKAPPKKLTVAEKAAEKVAVATKKLLDIETAKARTTRDVLTKVISAAARTLTDALKAGDTPMVKSAKAKLDKIEKAMMKATA